jgi:hypothetical protein
MGFQLTLANSPHKRPPDVSFWGFTRKELSQKIGAEEGESKLHLHHIRKLFLYWGHKDRSPDDIADVRVFDRDAFDRFFGVALSIDQ